MRDRLLVAFYLVLMLSVLLIPVLLTAPLNNVSTPPANVVRVFAEERDGSSNGTGTLIRSDLIITNHHVVRNCTKVRVLFPDWTLYDAEVIKINKKWDLAALRITPVLIPPMPLGERPEKDNVVTVGGYGPGWYADSSGPVTKFYAPNRRSPRDLFNIYAYVRSGDSGGPVVKDGQLVGVIFGCSDGAYAITVDRLRKFLEGIQ